MQYGEVTQQNLRKILNMSLSNNDTQSSDCVYLSPFLAHLWIYIVSDFRCRQKLQFVPNLDTDLKENNNNKKKPHGQANGVRENCDELVIKILERWWRDRESRNKSRSRNLHPLFRTQLFKQIIINSLTFKGPGYYAGLAACYGLVSPKLESRKGQKILSCPYQAWGPR